MRSKAYLAWRRSRASVDTSANTKSPSIPTSCAPTGSASQMSPMRFASSNGEVGGRLLEMSGREYFVRGRGYLQKLADLKQLTIRASAAGTPIRIGDVGTVRFGGDIRRGLAELNGEGETVGAIVIARYGENALDVIRRVQSKLDELKGSLPAGVEIVPTYDRSSLIDRAIQTLRQSLTEEGITVSLVIVLFLLHFRSALLPIISLANRGPPLVHPDVRLRYPRDHHEPRRHRDCCRRHRRCRDRDDRGLPQEARTRAARHLEEGP